VTNELEEPAERVEPFADGGSGRVDSERGHPGVPVGADAASNPGLVADQVVAQDHLVGHARRGLFPLPADPQRLDLARRLGEAGPAVGVVVEVRLRGAHRSQGEGHRRLPAGSQAFQVVAELDVAAHLDIDVREGPARALGAGLHRGEEGVRVFGEAGGAEPAVGDLAGVRGGRRAARCQVDRQVRPRPP